MDLLESEIYNLVAKSKELLQLKTAKLDLTQPVLDPVATLAPARLETELRDNEQFSADLWLWIQNGKQGPMPQPKAAPLAPSNADAMDDTVSRKRAAVDTPLVVDLRDGKEMDQDGDGMFAHGLFDEEEDVVGSALDLPPLPLPGPATADTRPLEAAGIAAGMVPPPMPPPSVSPSGTTPRGAAPAPAASSAVPPIGSRYVAGTMHCLTASLARLGKPIDAIPSRVGSS